MVLGLGVVLVVVGVASLFLMNMFGGGEQMQRATDSGNLGLARAELDQFRIPIPSTGDQLQFNGASDHTDGGNGVVDLLNINSVMGQALLVNLNACAIAKQGTDQGATAHAHQAVQAANQLAHSLSVEMADSSKAFNKFRELSDQNATHQLGTGSTQSAKIVTFSYVDRGQASNVFVLPQQMPDYDFTSQSSELFNSRIGKVTTAVSGASDRGKNHYLLGYANGVSPDATFDNVFFVPLMPGAKPHLISKRLFDEDADPGNGPAPFAWQAPVGNAVCQTSKKDSQVASQFAAHAQIEPITPTGTPIRIRHGFIRVVNGAPMMANGFADGNNKDVFVFTENHPQIFPLERGGMALPYFVGDKGASYPYNANNAKEYIDKLMDSKGANKDCSAFNVGYALAGDKLGLGGVSKGNCAKIDGMDKTPIDNKTLANPSSGPNEKFRSFSTPDNHGQNARGLIEAAYKLNAAQGSGSNSGSYSVADIVNLALLSTRAQGLNFALNAGQFTSGIATVPATRGPLTSPMFKVTNQPEGANLASSNQGIKKNGKVWTFLEQRFFQIDPTWKSYSPNGVDSILSSTNLQLGAKGYIYFSSKANGGKGGIVFKDEASALQDAPWLQSFVYENPDSKPPLSPTEVESVILASDEVNKTVAKPLINVAGDWGYPHPYSTAPNVEILNWFSVTPSSGYNNLLGDIKMGSLNVPAGKCPAVPTDYVIKAGAGAGGSDTLTLPSGNCDSAVNFTGPG